MCTCVRARCFVAPPPIGIILPKINTLLHYDDFLIVKDNANLLSFAEVGLCNGIAGGTSWQTI